MNEDFDNLKYRYRLKGILIGVDKIVLNSVVVIEDVFWVCCLIELDGERFGEWLVTITKDSVLLVDDAHKNSVVSVNSDVNNL